MKLSEVMDLPSIIKVKGHSRSSPTTDQASHLIINYLMILH